MWYRFIIRVMVFEIIAVFSLNIYLSLTINLPFLFPVLAHALGLSYKSLIRIFIILRLFYSS